ncbi:MAG: TonB family protein [Hyphomicrobium sp.]
MSQPTSQYISNKLGIGDNQLHISFAENDRKFYIFLIFAFLIHASLLISITSLKPRRLGSPNGADNAISVSLINSNDLLSRATVDDQSAGIQTQKTPDAVEKEKKPQPEPPSEQEARKTPDVSDAETKKSGNDPQFRTDETLDANSSQGKNSTKKKNETKPSDRQNEKNTKQENNKVANLDLNQPQIFTAPAGGGGAGVQRPPGITRSGENDDFARGVIRALQQTMPQLSNTYGRVSVRIILDKNGSLVSTDVIKPSQVAGLDQSVVFATRQSSFPLPPLNANSADLTFFVTYIYR